MTYRADLDNFLVKLAVDNRTVFFKDNVLIQKINRKENSITYLENNKEKKVNYKILVGAWGNNIRFNKMIDLYPFERFDLSSSWEGPAGPRFKKYSNDHSLTQIMKKYPGFVCYIFPKSELITAGIFTSKYPFPPIWKNVWNDFMDFWKLDKSIKPHYAVIPIRDPKKPVARDNILLIGDAAGLADPFVGEGIHNAFISGRIAATKIIDFFKKENYDLASEYNKNFDN
jgi:flavin-dependent dehydrogenase